MRTSALTGLVKIVDDMLWIMEESKVAALMALDLLAAFDMVDHSILLKVLQRNLEWRANVSHGLTCIKDQDSERLM